MGSEQLFRIFLYLHIAAGFTGLVVGPIAMSATKSRGTHTRYGTIYFALMTLVCATALVLSALHWSQSWWLSLIAVGSYFSAFTGYRAVKLRRDGWLRPHISGMLGSYIAMTTALIVTNIHRIPGSDAMPSIAFWILPTIIGTPLIRRVLRRHVPQV